MAELILKNKGKIVLIIEMSNFRELPYQVRTVKQIKGEEIIQFKIIFKK